MFILSVLEYCIFSSNRPIMSTSTHYGSTYASRFLPIYWVLANIWIVILCFRQSRRIGIEHTIADKRSFSIWRIFLPNIRPAKAARNLGILIMLELSLSLSSALFMSLNIISLTTYNLISSGGFLIICTMYIVVYINNSTEANTFMIKFTGISMVTIFLVIGGMSSLVMSNYDSTYSEIRKAQLSYIGDYVDAENADFPEEVEFIIISDTSNMMAVPEIIYSREKDFQILEPLRFWEKPPSIRNLITKEIKGSNLFDYQGYIRNIRFFTQINNQNYYYFSFEKNNSLYGVGYKFIQYRKYMHNKAKFLFLIMLGFTLFYLIIYPFLFYTGLVIPLNNLLKGVHKVDNGNMEVNIPIQYNDEIGYISGLFNKMVSTIKEKNISLNDYATNLEKMVIERTHELAFEKEKTEKLLLNILPLQIAERLKKGETSISDYFEEVAILFADIVGFTNYCSGKPSAHIVEILNEIFNAFDKTTEELGLEKIKTIGDGYLVMAGGLKTSKGSLLKTIDLGDYMINYIDNFSKKRGIEFSIRIGIHIGNVTAGVIGKTKFAFDIWGDTVNIASRMESTGIPMEIHITEEVVNLLKDKSRCSYRGEFEIKGKGKMKTYIINRYSRNYC